MRIGEGEAKDGRLLFSSQESLENTIKALNEEDEAGVAEKFALLYQGGFRSHSPLVDPDNEVLMELLSKEYIERAEAEGISLEDDVRAHFEFIDDPTFAALVNQDNEIVVADTLYKYTKDKGLYFSHVKDTEHLLGFVETKVENTDTYRRYGNDDICFIRQRYGGTTRMNNRVSRYFAPIRYIDDPCYPRNHPVSVTPRRVANVPPKDSEEEKLNKILEGLPLCGGEEHWFTNRFGLRRSCINKYEKRRRMATIFWNQDWKVVKSVGVQVKSQRRKWGVWWAAKVDEIYLGVNRILLKYNYPAPDIREILGNHPTDIASAPHYKGGPLYLHDGKVQVDRGYSPTRYVGLNIQTFGGDLPFFSTKNTDFLNVYIPHHSFIHGFHVNDHYPHTHSLIKFGLDDIFSQSNLEEFYRLGLNYLEDCINRGDCNPFDSKGKEFAVTVQNTKDDLTVVYFSERYNKNNVSKLKRVFYRDWGVKIALTFNAAGSGIGIGKDNAWRFTPQIPDNKVFKNYYYAEYDFFGMTRRGATWRGYRMVGKN